MYDTGLFINTKNAVANYTIKIGNVEIIVFQLSLSSSVMKEFTVNFRDGYLFGANWNKYRFMTDKDEFNAIRETIAEMKKEIKCRHKPTSIILE